MKDNILEEGDVLYTYTRWGSDLIRSVVSKVTPKRAKAGYYEVQREVIKERRWNDAEEELVVKIVGEYGKAMLETTTLLTEWNTQVKRKKVSQLKDGLKVTALSLSQCDELISLIESFSKTPETE